MTVDEAVLLNFIHKNKRNCQPYPQAQNAAVSRSTTHLNPFEVVDEPFPASATSGRMVAKEPTHKSAQAAVGRRPGPRRTEGTERLMDIMPARVDAAPPAICPLCREASLVTSTARHEGDVVTGNYVCGNDHIWLERWTDLSGRD